jgi:hypothetical protein
MKGGGGAPYASSLTLAMNADQALGVSLRIGPAARSESRTRSVILSSPAQLAAARLDVDTSTQAPDSHWWLFLHVTRGGSSAVNLRLLFPGPTVQ